MYLRILSTDVNVILREKKSLCHGKLAAWNKITQLFNDPLHRQTDTERDTNVET